MTRKRDPIHVTNAESPATFEKEMWHMLARHGLSGTAQTSIGNAMLRLVGEHLGIKPSDSPKRRVRLIAGNNVHYFLPEKEQRGDDRSRCGRVTRDQLKPQNATDNVIYATCQHCKKSVLADRRR